MIGEVLNKIERLPDKIINGLFVSFLFCILLYFYFHANRGFDITDESYYFLWAMQPENVVGSVTFFGYLTKWIWLSSGENIAVFRMMSVVTLSSASILFAVTLSHYCHNHIEQLKDDRRSMVPFFITVTIVGFVYFKLWLLTPSYNLLALVSILIAMSGLFLAFFKKQTSLKAIIFGAFLVSAGGVIAFLSKPTTAFLLSVITIIWVFFHWRNNKKWYFLIATFSATLFLSVIFIQSFGGWDKFYFSILEGMKFGDLLGGGHTIFSLVENVYLSFHRASKYILYLPIIALIGWLVISKNTHRGVKKIFITLIMLFLFYIGFSQSGHPLKLVLFFTLTDCVLIFLVFLVNKLDKSTRNTQANFIFLATLLICLPYVYAFGTNNEIIQHSSAAFIFHVPIWIYSFRLLIGNYKYKNIVLNSLYLFFAAIVIATLQLAYNQPYRLIDSIKYQNQEVKLLSSSSTIKVDAVTAKYINDLKEIALKNDWEENTPLIDLTGGSPGALVILNAKIVGKPWLFGSYSGSVEFAKQSIKLSNIDPFDAWILTAPNGNIKNPISVLSDTTFEFKEKYQLVGKVTTGHRNEIQFLYRPKNETK